MNKRTIVLLSILGVLFVLYAWFVLMPRGGDLKAVIVQRPNRPVEFVFNREQLFEEVKVLVYEQAPETGESFEREVWHLVLSGDPEEERRPRESIMYGRGIRGLEPPEGMDRRGEPLRPGKYRFEARTAEGDEVKIDFAVAGA